MKRREPTPGANYVGGKYIIAPASVVEKSLEELTSVMPTDKKARKPKPKRK